MRYILIIFLAFVAFPCRGQSIAPVNPNIQYAKPLVFPTKTPLNCNDLPAHYSSYDQALKMIAAAHYKFIDKCNTASSSWIQSAVYGSCDGKYGFFLLKTKSKWYIFSNVPISVWEGFKAAPSKGTYYNYHIRGNYQFNI